MSQRYTLSVRDGHWIIQGEIKWCPCVTGRIVAPQNVHILIPGACEYVTLQGEGDFADMTELRIFRRKDSLNGSSLIT